MARLPRLTLANEAHLVLLQGLSGHPLFVDDDDRRGFLLALREGCAEQRVAVEAYTLDDEQVYLLLRPVDDAGLSLALQGLGRRYVAAHNRRHGRHGSLWAGRFRAAPVQSGATELQALLFIEGLALRRGRVQRVEDDTWSSAPHHLGLRRDPLVSDGPAWWGLGNTPFEREAAYRQRQAEGLSAHQISALAAASHKGWPLGDASWLANLALRTQRPLAPRPRGRPARPRVD